MTSPTSTSPIQKLIAFLYKIVLFLLRCCHVKVIAMIGKGVGHLAWVFCSYRKDVVRRNLRIILDPMLRGAELDALAKKNMILTCMNFACALKVGMMSAEEMAQSIRLEGKDIFEASGMEGRTGIACIPHAGNWEVLARIRPLFTKVEHFGSMYRRIDNPALEKIVYECRTRFGCEMYSRADGLRGVLRMAKKGGLLGVLSDQFTHEGMLVPYFGKMAGTTPLPAILRKACKGQLFSVFTRNSGLGQWDAVLGRTIELQENTLNQVAADTICVNQALEKAQRENILDGFWMHHRWKCRRRFAPKQEEGVEDLAMPHVRLPFRILVALERGMKIDDLVPALRCLKASRRDAQVMLICDCAEKEQWQAHCDCLCTSNGTPSLREQLQADTIYQDGPFDVLFMWSRDGAIRKAVKSQGPVLICELEEGMNVSQMRAADYLEILETKHGLTPDDI